MKLLRRIYIMYFFIVFILGISATRGMAAFCPTPSTSFLALPKPTSYTVKKTEQWYNAIRRRILTIGNTIHKQIKAHPFITGVGASLLLYSFKMAHSGSSAQNTPQQDTSTISNKNRVKKDLVSAVGAHKKIDTHEKINDSESGDTPDRVLHVENIPSKKSKIQDSRDSHSDSDDDFAVFYTDPQNKPKKQSYETAVHRAARDGDTEQLRILLSNETGVADINATGKSLNTPIMYAVQKGHENTVQFLIDACADLTWHNLEQKNLLDMAFATENKNIISLLCTAMIQTSCGKELINTSGLNHAIHFARMHNNDMSMVDLVCAYGADINTKHSQSSYTQLMKAVQRNEGELVKKLCSFDGILVHWVAREDNASALSLAMQLNNQEMIDLLLSKGAHRGISVMHAHKLFTIALQKGNIDLFKKLWLESTGADKEKQADHSAILLSLLETNPFDTDLLSWVLQKTDERSVNVNVCAPHTKRTPLHESAKYQYCSKTVALLLHYGADMYAQDSEGKTPLMLACQYSGLDVVKLFIDHQREMSVSLQELMRPMPLALVDVIEEYDHLDSVLSVKDNRGKTALDYARNRDVSSVRADKDTQEKQEIIDCLLQQGARGLKI